jgi:putative Mg2+ transporter-C (MgtC) family protein
MGAAMTTLTSQYLYLCMGYYTDMARLGAQVIAGIGFIGAGTIIVTKQQRVKGLTTAAGLWVSAIVGLTLGAGFFEGGIFVTVLVLCAELLFVKLEYRLLYSNRERIYYIEYSDKECLEAILAVFNEKNIRVLNMEVTRSEENEEQHASAIFYVRFDKANAEANIESFLNPVSGLHLIEELSFNDSTAEDCEIMGKVTIKADPLAIQTVAESQGGIYKAELGATVDLHVDVCFDVSVYGILKFSLSDDSYAKQDRSCARIVW